MAALENIIRFFSKKSKNQKHQKYHNYYQNTSVYPADQRPAPNLSALSAPLFSRLRRSPLGASVAFETVPHRRLRATPQARAWLARAAVVSPASAQASWQTGRQLRTPAIVARADFLKVDHCASFSQFLHIKGQNFPNVFYPLTSTYDPYERWKFLWKSEVN